MGAGGKFDFGVMYLIFIEAHWLNLVHWLNTISPFSNVMFNNTDINQVWFSAGASGNVKMLEFIKKHHRVSINQPDVILGAVSNNHAHVLDWVFAAYAEEHKEYEWYDGEPFNTDMDSMDVLLRTAAKKGNMAVLARIVSAIISDTDEECANVITSTLPNCFANKQPFFCSSILEEAIRGGQLEVLIFFKNHGVTLKMLDYKRIYSLKQQIKDKKITDLVLVQWIKTELKCKEVKKKKTKFFENKGENKL